MSFTDYTIVAWIRRWHKELNGGGDNWSIQALKID